MPQARDRKGRFTSGGGSSASIAGIGGKSTQKRHAKLIKKGYTATRTTYKADANGRATANGKHTATRITYHPPAKKPKSAGVRKFLRRTRKK